MRPYFRKFPNLNIYCQHWTTATSIYYQQRHKIIWFNLLTKTPEYFNRTKLDAQNQESFIIKKKKKGTPRLRVFVLVLVLSLNYCARIKTGHRHSVPLLEQNFLLKGVLSHNTRGILDIFLGVQA